MFNDDAESLIENPAINKIFFIYITVPFLVHVVF